MGGDIGCYICSKNSVFAGPNDLAYGAAKADQAHQVRLLAAELGEHGIRVNGIDPDGVVRGSGIFTSRWAPNAHHVRRRQGRVERVLRQAHLLKHEVLPEHWPTPLFPPSPAATISRRPPAYTSRCDTPTWRAFLR